MPVARSACPPCAQLQLACMLAHNRLSMMDAMLLCRHYIIHGKDAPEAQAPSGGGRSNRGQTPSVAATEPAEPAKPALEAPQANGTAKPE